MGELRNAALGLFILTGIKLISIFYLNLLDLDHPLFLFGPSEESNESDFKPNVPRIELDYKRCADLHNQIVEIGWKGYHPEADPSTRNLTTWWVYYGEEAQNISGRLTPSLIEFLKLAQMPEDSLSFTYHLDGLSHPSQMWYGLEDMDDEFSAVVLYSANEGSHRMGLVFNHEHNLAAFAPSIFDYPIDSQLTYPLETALMMYLSMINVGKIASLPEPEYEDQPCFGPWVLRPFSDFDIKIAVEEFASLVDAIVGKIPSEARGSLTFEYLNSDTKNPLIDNVTLEYLQMEPSFLRSFLSLAPKPPFTYIAPGLTLPTPSSLTSLLYSLPLPDWFSEQKYNPADLPLLLFPSNKTVSAPPNTTLDGSPLYGYTKTTLNNVTAGLYLVSQSRSMFESFANGVKLITPFPLGSNGWVRKADWSFVGDEWHVVYNYTELYQMGTNSFVNGHAILLHQVLRSWRAMVEDGVWEVDGDGVKGGMEMWKMADTEEGWWRFKMDAALW
ncbi:hypothetical protein K432DRAFT_403430 [Lepidopterella palustris CBS 459.81]|uniref:Uncharacterized protein n=1 Tax=Lepidopterella palustris CBS 459.81 TaxID=1314670 RepID=A0A8E2JGV7_9PEZI|nr:hypothetical protein K432DRAFT_403430 [Lepidopterella palustris CBS 459.81]